MLPTANLNPVATHPQREPIFTETSWEDEKSFWLRIAVDFGGGNTDSVQEALCPASESHALFSEVLEEHKERLTRVLIRRHAARLDQKEKLL
jgi:hypothetical protein